MRLERERTDFCEIHEVREASEEVRLQCTELVVQAFRIPKTGVHCGCRCERLIKRRIHA